MKSNKDILQTTWAMNFIIEVYPIKNLPVTFIFLEIKLYSSQSHSTHRITLKLAENSIM